MEDKNNQPSDPQNKDATPERRPPASSGNLLWILVAVGVGTWIMMSLFGTPDDNSIPYSELLRLVRQGSPEKNPEAQVTVTQGPEDKQVTYRYSNLEDLVIGPHEITGKVTKERIVDSSEEPAEPEEGVRFRTARLGMEDQEDDNRLLKDAMDAGFTNIRAEEAPSGLSQYMPMLVFTAILVLFFVFMMRRLGGTGGAMAFGRSRGKLLAQEDIGETFDDVAGIDEAVDELREVVEFLATPEKYRLLGGRIPKGVLLVGPPGTGKTLLAKAVAGEAGVPFFSMSGSDFVEMFVGVGAARVRDMFQQAEARAPCIVFIDELDALGKTRGSGIVGGHDEREQTLNALLVEMDGFNSNNGVIVMAASNRPETLDPALLRPGRFDRHVLVDRPDVRGREKILDVHAKSVKIDESVDLKAVASITSGFVGADLANLVNEAALLAARANKESVTMAEFTEGVERVTAGLEKKQRVIHEDEKQRVAYHESAHALVAFCLPNTDPVHKVSIIPRGLAALGYTMQRPEGDRYLMTQSDLESRIQVLLAGTVGEELIFDDISTGAQNDLERASEFARRMVMDFGMSGLGRVSFRADNRSPFLTEAPELSHPRLYSEQTAREIDQEVRRIVEQSMEKAGEILRTRRQALEALADRLIEKEVIDTAELREVMEANSPGPSIVPGTTDVAKRSSPKETEKPDGEAGTA